MIKPVGLPYVEVLFNLVACAEHVSELLLHQCRYLQRNRSKEQFFKAFSR